MQKKRKLILFFLLFAFFVSAGHDSAALEVKYPAISNQTVTEATKLPDYMLYLFNAGVIIGFIAVFISMVWAGVLYFLSPINSSFARDSRDRFSGAISGLLILILTYLIVITIDPRLNAFNFNKLPAIPIDNTETQTPGVYLYKEAGCANNEAQPHAGSIADLGPDLRKHVNSSKIVQDAINKNYFISILYGETNYWGKCQYVNPDGACQTVTPFATSASIYRYNPDPKGDGVYFYRKSCFNNSDSNNTNDLVAQCNKNSGGYFKVENSEIKGSGGYLYTKNLDDLKFISVPSEEQNCTKYDKNGSCTSRTAQSLAGENISSIVINGNYVVLLIYFDPKSKDPPDVWTSCQEFPTPNDANKIGLQQLKWEHIRNTGGVVPNYVIIFPVGY